jgi:hypothetical protein
MSSSNRKHRSRRGRHKAAAPKAKTIPPKAGSEPDVEISSPEWELLVDQVQFLERFFEAHPAREAEDFMQRVHDITACHRNIEFEDDLPTTAQLREALDLFYGIPEDVRRLILNGWGMDRWPARAEVFHGNTLQPMLVIAANKRRDNGMASAAHELVVEDDIGSPVRLQIRVGTQRHEVVKALWDLWHVVETQWPILTEIDPEEAADEPLPIALSRRDPDKSYPAPIKDYTGSMAPHFGH